MTSDGLSSGDEGDAGLATEVDVSTPSAVLAAPAAGAFGRDDFESNDFESHRFDRHHMSREHIEGNGLQGSDYPGSHYPGTGFEDNASEDTVSEDDDPTGKHLDSSIVEELTNRLPTSELVKIIKNALECGRRNVPFTESALLRAMTFGSSLMPSHQASTRAPRN
jgi:hypothetical protein